MMSEAMSPISRARLSSVKSHCMGGQYLTYCEATLLNISSSFSVMRPRGALDG